MSIFDQLNHDYLLHVKSRTRKHASYPDRFNVADNMIAWETAYPAYAPCEFNAPVVLNPNTVWADPQDISLVQRKLVSFVSEVKLNDQMLPLNPFGRTGLAGRGVLGKWGANFAVDAVITTLDPSTGLFNVLTIKRRDTGETAFPGGMVDPGEDATVTRNRELVEEISINLDDLSSPLYEAIVSAGYVDDPRNTDHSWLETTAIHTHVAFDIAQRMKLVAGDDAVGVKWIEITPETIKGFYANHGLTLLKAVNLLLTQGNKIVRTNIADSFNAQFN